MKIFRFVRIIIPVFFLHLWSCQPEEDLIPGDMLADENQLVAEVENYLLDAEITELSFNGRIAEDIIPCSDVSLEVPLVAWPGTEVGAFSVNHNSDYLIANFELDPDGEWDLRITQLLIEVKETKVTPKKSFIKTKKYLFPVHHLNGIKKYIYQIPLERLKLQNDMVDKCVSVAGIAHMSKANFRQTKFAIAENTADKRHSWKNWLHEYCISDCQAKTTLVGGIAWMDGIAYPYNSGETGYFEIFASEMENKYVSLFIPDPATGERVEVGKVEILFWGAASKYDLFMEFQPFDGYDITDANIYVGILDPIRGPETFKNPVSYPDQNSLVFKKELDFTPVYVAVAATVCSEKIIN